MNKYYAILGLPTTATKDDIRRKYRQLVLIWHPDKNPAPEAHNMFIAITEAYDILNGERKVPRTTLTTKRRAGSTPPSPPAKKTTRELYREKYLSERAKVRRDPKFAEIKSASEKRVRRWRRVIALASTGVLIPWFIPQLNGISCFILSGFAVYGILSLGFFAHNLRMQSEMTFGERDNYDYTEIRDYFLPKHKLRWGRPQSVRPHDRFKPW